MVKDKVMVGFVYFVVIVLVMENNLVLMIIFIFNVIKFYGFKIFFRVLFLDLLVLVCNVVKGFLINNFIFFYNIFSDNCV